MDTAEQSGGPAVADRGPVSHAVFRLARLHKLTAAQLLRPTGLHPPQELVMMRLWDAGPQRQADLASVMDADSATITRTIHRLERAGFVRRRPHATDGRVVMVEATPASQGLRGEVEAMWTALEERTVAGLDEQERATVLRVLERLEANLARPRT